MKEEFDKGLMIGNISYLLEKTGKKIGELEAEAGVSTGYISRLVKDEKSKPGIDFILGAAQALRVSVDTLLNFDLKKATPMERYLSNFLEKLMDDTLADKLDWIQEGPEDFTRGEVEQNEKAPHPMQSVKTFHDFRGGDYPDEVHQVVLVSHAFKEQTAIAGNCFHLRLKNGYFLYLMNFHMDVDSPEANLSEDGYAKEIWMLRPNGEKEYICSNQDQSGLGNLTETLYQAVTERTKYPIKKDLKNVIDAFMQDDLKDDPPEPTYVPYNSDDDIPF